MGAVFFKRAYVASYNGAPPGRWMGLALATDYLLSVWGQLIFFFSVFIFYV